MGEFLKILLYPFSYAYGIINAIRNSLYDRRIFKYTQFDIPVISVGNLTVGGTGKTPMVEYLIELLKSKYSLATLSRGYGRKTRGFRIAGPEDNAQTVGDEPFQLYRKYENEIVVSVGEERILAVPQLLYNHSDIQVILLDDAFQHRAIKPSFQILLNDYNRPYYNDLPMPSGRLREFVEGAGRADVIVVTKCPEDIGSEEITEIKSKLHKITPEKPVFFTTLSYQEPQVLNTALNIQIERVILVTGIANVAPLLSHIKKRYKLVEHLKFKDHYYYSKKDIKKINELVRKDDRDVVVLTTDKDAVKLKSLLHDIEAPLCSLPIKVKFLDNEKYFQELVFDAARYQED